MAAAAVERLPSDTVQRRGESSTHPALAGLEAWPTTILWIDHAISGLTFCVDMEAPMPLWSPLPGQGAFDKNKPV